MPKQLVVALFLAIVARPAGASMLLEKGIRLGGDMSGYAGKDSMTSATKKSTYGPEAGVFLRLGFGDVLAVEPEVLYHRVGSTYTAPAVSWTDKLDYVQTSVFARVSLGLVSLHAGPSVGFLVGAKTVVDPGGSIDIKDRVNSVDPGIAGGLGVAFKLPSVGTVSLDFRARLGLATIVKVPAGAPAQEVTLNVISLLAGFAF